MYTLQSSINGQMRDFSIRARDQTVTFRFGVDFTEGESRLCWTLPGIEKLIAAGLMAEGIRPGGNLRSKPVAVVTLMREAGVSRAV
jgi:hypothetical protein